MIVFQEKNLIQQLKFNKVGIMPTDTVYGLVTKIDNEIGLMKIYALKKRNFEKKMPILVGSIEQLEKLIVFEPKIKSFLKKLNQPTTVIYEKKIDVLKKSAIWNEKTLAIRLVKWPWLQKILLTTGPLVATSCNKINEASALKWKEILKWEAQVDFIFHKKTQDCLASELIDWKTKKKLRTR